MPASVLAFSGSLRSGSFNRSLVAVAAGGAREAGASVTELDIRDYPLPVYDADLEKAEGLPANARALKELFKSHGGLLISSPEYNSSLSAALKNVIDWVSRTIEGEAPLECFDGKVAGLMAASPGALGGLRGLVHLRAILGNIRVIVLPQQKAIAKAHEAFDDEGRLRDEADRQAVEGIGSAVARAVERLAG
jgi:NAD(P)H-dependent FMN reductase